MTQKEILSRLCYYDLRNPDGLGGYMEWMPDVYDDEELEEIEKRRTQGNCSCDNCFYGRTQLAEYILTLI